LQSEIFTAKCHVPAGIKILEEEHTDYSHYKQNIKVKKRSKAIPVTDRGGL
jgi:hypothetical protein